MATPTKVTTRTTTTSSATDAEGITTTTTVTKTVISEYAASAAAHVKWNYPLARRKTFMALALASLPPPPAALSRAALHLYVLHTKAFSEARYTYRNGWRQLATFITFTAFTPPHALPTGKPETDSICTQP